MAHKRAKHTHPIKDEHGFSLLELVVSVGVVLVLIIVGVLSYNNISGSAKQSATQKAADEVYDKAFSALLDDDAATKPEDVAEEYNKSSENVVTTVDVLPTGGIKVTATLGEDYFAVRETPVSAGSDGNSPIEQPTDGTGETITSNTYKTIMNFQCDSNVDEGILPIVNIPESGKATLVNMNTNEEKVLNNVERSTERSHYYYEYPQTVLSSVRMDAGVPYKLTVEAEIDSAASPFNPETSFAIMSLHEYYPSPKKDATSCLTSIDNIGNGIASISTYYAPKLESVPSTIPSTVTSLKYAFSGAQVFDQDISGWDVSNVTDMERMFAGTQAFNNGNQPLDWGEKTAKVENMTQMFSNTPIFNQDVSSWDVSNVKDMSRTFFRAYKFNQDISGWDVSNVEDMNGMFHYAQAFNNGGQPLDWGEKTANVEYMNQMFDSANAFNQDISGWNVSSVTNMNSMFKDAWAFNQDITSWDVSNVTNMGFMFSGTRVFNQDISSWDFSNVTIMSGMFSATRGFNQDISDWNVSNVTNMSSMFQSNTVFNNNNQPLDWGEKTANVTNMTYMFSYARGFNQDISGWKVPKIADTPPNFATGSGIKGMPQWGVA